MVLKLRADGAGVAIFAYASTIPEDQQHYELVVAFKNNEDYKNAILELSKIEASSTYYEEAQKIVDIAKESYVNAVLNEVKQCNSVEDFEKSFQKMYEAEEILEFLTVLVNTRLHLRKVLKPSVKPRLARQQIQKTIHMIFLILMK